MNRTASGLPILPALHEAELIRCERPYEGPISVGDIFAWEPDLPFARQLVIVSRIEPEPPPPLVVKHARGTAIISNGSGPVIWTFDFPERKTETWNDLSRFREAVVPTLYKPQNPRPL